MCVCVCVQGCAALIAWVFLNLILLIQDQPYKEKAHFLVQFSKNDGYRIPCVLTYFNFLWFSTQRSAELKKSSLGLITLSFELIFLLIQS